MPCGCSTFKRKMADGLKDPNAEPEVFLQKIKS